MPPGLIRGIVVSTMAAALLGAMPAAAQAVPAISVTDPVVDEPDTQNAPAQFQVSLSEPSSQVVTVDFATANGTAVYGSQGSGDYFRRLSTTLTFLPGQTQKVVDVTVLPDARDEVDETFHLDLSSAVGATLADSRGTATITDDDAPPSIAVNDVSLDEPDSSNQLVRFEVSLSAPSGKQVTVDFATANGTAAYGSQGSGDYFRRLPSTVTFAPGQTSRTVDVWVLADTRDEFDETFSLNLSNPTGDATLADSQGTGTILDDDDPPAAAVNDVYVNEAVGENVLLTFDVTLSAASGKSVSVDFATANGTAQFGSQGQGDYFRRALSTLTFAPGQTRRTVDVWVLHDSVAEPSEAFYLDLSNALNATIGRDRGTGTIHPQPRVSVADVTLNEPDSANELASFEVSLDVPSTRPVTVDFATSDGTAAFGSQGSGDYFRRQTTTLTFLPGQTSHQVDVWVLPDSRDEPDETFNLDLSNVTGGASIGDNRGVATIVDDDPAPTISVTDVAVDEPAADSRSASFEVALSGPSDRNITVDFATTNGSAKFGSAGQGDYFRRLSTTLTFLPGQTSKVVDVSVLPDSADEFDETFHLDLTNPTGTATIADARGTATIADQDATPSISVSNPQLDEPNGPDEPLVFAVTLSHPSEKGVSATAATAPGTASPGDLGTGAGGDYGPQSAALTFAAGQTSKSVSVPVHSDAVDEHDETVRLGLSGVVNASGPASAATGTIVDDDAAPTLTISDTQVGEPSAGSSNATFDLSLSSASEKTVQVAAATTAGTASTADFTPLPPATTVVFAPGATTAELTVPVGADTLDEFDETFAVTLTGDGSAVAGDFSATATIADHADDLPPTVALGDVTASEPAAGSSNADVPITLSAASGKPVEVQFSTAAQTATAGSDYTGARGRVVTIPTGSTATTTPIAVHSDNLREPSETAQTSIASPVNATLGRAAGTMTIGANCHDREPQTFETAMDIGPLAGDVGDPIVASPFGASICTSDEDWYKVQIREELPNEDNFLSASIELDVADGALNGDLELFVYNSDGTYWDSSEADGTADESVYWYTDDTVFDDSDWIYVSIVGYPDPITGQPATNDYRLQIVGNQ